MKEQLEKIASELDKAADFIEKYEGEVSSIKEKEAAKIQEETTKKRAAILNPIKKKLASIVDESEIEEKLKEASTETLELISKGFAKEAEESIENDWGNVEESKNSRGKMAGYKDPIEAFALGD